MTENKEYEDIPYIKYPDSEMPVSGRCIYPEGHPRYYAPFNQIVREIVNEGVLSQARLWDAYNKCPNHVAVYKQPLPGSIGVDQ